MCHLTVIEPLEPICDGERAARDELAAQWSLAELVNDREVRCQVKDVEKWGGSRAIVRCFEDSINPEMLPRGMAWASDVKELVGLFARPPQRSRLVGQRGSGDPPDSWVQFCLEERRRNKLHGLGLDAHNHKKISS